MMLPAEVVPIYTPTRAPVFLETCQLGTLANFLIFANLTTFFKKYLSLVLSCIYFNHE